jgi:hypothetical protein
MNHGIALSSFALASMLAVVTLSEVQAAACTGVSVNNADTSDVTFQAVASDACVIAVGNPQSGPNGDPSVFSGSFPASASPWTLIAKVSSAGAVTNYNPFAGVTFSSGFVNTNGTSGTWSLTATPGATLDLVFAMHASNRSGSFFFDDKNISPTGNGTWLIEWHNNGGNVPDYSNLTLFARDVAVVPEPQAYGLALAGLLVVGFMRRRKS